MTTTATREKIIQDLQCKHADWLIKYDKELSYGGGGLCAQQWVDRNLLISNLIEVVYRYQPYSDFVTSIATNQLYIVSSTGPTVSVPYTYNLYASIASPTYLLGSVNMTGTLIQLIEAIVAAVNTNTATHGFYAVPRTHPSNPLFEGVDIYNLGFKYPYEVVVTTETGCTTTITQVANDLDFSTVGKYLDTKNCLTYDEIAKIVCQLRDLLKDCNC